MPAIACDTAKNRRLSSSNASGWVRLAAPLVAMLIRGGATTTGGFDDLIPDVLRDRGSHHIACSSLRMSGCLLWMAD
jgi:hypothetical protein